jgi:hypothetical protein
LKNKDTFYKIVDSFSKLPNKITALTRESFEIVFGGSEAAETRDIIYFYLSSKPVPRLNGESRILYIGQTKKSFKARYMPQARRLSTTKANTIKYNTVFEKYGPIEIAYCDFKSFGETITVAEGQFLWWYFQNHSEYPPFNYTKTSVRTDVLEDVLVKE